MSQSATSSGQYRPAWKSIVSRARTWRAIASGSRPMNRCAKASNPSIVSPDPTPTTPSSVSTRTIVTGKRVRGSGSHAAGNGGSSGTTSRSRRMAVIRMRRQYACPSSAGPEAPDAEPGADRMRYCRHSSADRRTAREEDTGPMSESRRQAAVVEFDHVTKRYDVDPAKAKSAKTPGAVNDLSMVVPAGKICCLVGPSGCGKTTSLKMVNRLIEPTSGRILIDGTDAGTRELTDLRRGIGYVIQQVGLFPHQTIGENVATVPRLLGWSKDRQRARSEE